MLSTKLLTPPFMLGMPSLFSNLIAWWDFNESSGNRIDLVSGTTATDSGGVTRVAGPSTNLPYAAQFAPTGTKHFSIADSLDTRVDSSGSMTIMVWVKTPSSIGNQDILGKGSFDYLLDMTGAPVFRTFFGSGTVSYSSITPVINTWYCIFVGIDGSTNKVFMQINNGVEQLTASAITRLISATPLYFGRSVNNRYTNAAVAAVGIWKKYLSSQERSYLYNSGQGKNYPFGNSITSIPQIITPVQYQVQQTSGSNGSVSITGAIRYITSSVEASFNGGAFTQIASNVRGLFTANLSSQNNGQGSLAVRAAISGNTSTKTTVGLGDIFVIAGQSNASGRVTNLQSYSHASLNATMFANDYTWKNLTDFVDTNTNQVDTVSSDSGTTGSPWPLVATLYLAARSAPCAFVPCAKGGTTISQWQPGANHQDRTTLYGSMVYRALQTGAKAILWWQGEQDAFNGTSASTYESSMVTIVNALATDLPGVKFMPAKLHKGNTYSDGNAANIQTAIANVWSGGYTNVVSGPDLSDLRSDAGDHFTSNSSATTIATRWWSALQTAFSW